MVQQQFMVQTAWRCLVALMLVWLGNGTICAQTEFTPGQIQPKVVCQENADHSYALYLPKAYTKDKKWPIVYAFDPGGNGSAPVELLQEAAEDLGYIVVGSNNSHNGLNVPISEIVRIFWRDTRQRLSFDEKQIYTAGMSGGCMVATAIARLSKGEISGTFLVGSPRIPELLESKQLPFIVFGSAGTSDFNYFHVRDIIETLQKNSIPSTFVVFDGTHGWCDKQTARSALEWFDLQAMKTGRKPKNEAWLTAFYEKQIATARELETAGMSGAAYWKLVNLNRDYAGLTSTPELDSKIQALKNTKPVQQWFKDEVDLRRRHSARMEEFFGHYHGLFDEEGQFESFSAMRSLISPLKKQAADRTPSVSRQVANMVLDHCFIMMFEESMRYFSTSEYRKAITCLEIDADIRPDDQGPWYYIACAYAEMRDAKRAVTALKKVVERGPVRRAAIEKNKHFDPIAKEEAFQKWLASLGQSASEAKEKDGAKGDK